MVQQDYYGVLAIQPDVYALKDKREIREKHLNRHLDSISNLVPFFSTTVGAPVRLVAFPEFAITGTPMNPDSSWNGVAIDIPGEETDLLGEKAKELNIYIASHGWQEYPDFKGRPFSVAFLIDPNGKVVLKHHKVVVTKNVEAGDAAPGDAYDWFVEKFGDGLDAFFPVADTELGKIGFTICGEGQYLEISRGLMMNGAELLIRPNAWLEPYMSEPQDMMAVLSRANAYCNMCYLVESNWAYYHAPDLPVGTGAGRSQIIDYTGRILARTYSAAESGIAAEINIQSLRRYREECGFLARMVYMPTHIFRKVYETEMWPKNLLMKREKSFTLAECERLRREVVERRRDIYTPSRTK